MPSKSQNKDMDQFLILGLIEMSLMRLKTNSHTGITHENTSWLHEMVKKATLIPFLENTHLYDSKKSTKPTLKSLGNPFYFTQGIAKSFCFQSRL